MKTKQDVIDILRGRKDEFLKFIDVALDLDSKIKIVPFDRQLLITKSDLTLANELEDLYAISEWSTEDIQVMLGYLAASQFVFQVVIYSEQVQGGTAYLYPLVNRLIQRSWKLIEKDNKERILMYEPNWEHADWIEDASKHVKMAIHHMNVVMPVKKPFRVAQRLAANGHIIASNNELFILISGAIAYTIIAHSEDIAAMKESQLKDKSEIVIEGQPYVVTPCPDKDDSNVCNLLFTKIIH